MKAIDPGNLWWWLIIALIITAVWTWADYQNHKKK